MLFLSWLRVFGEAEGNSREGQIHSGSSFIGRKLGVGCADLCVCGVKKKMMMMMMMIVMMSGEL